MPSGLSARLLDIVNALPLRPGLRVLEIGCGPGAAAREIALAVRVGALDGRHPEAGRRARARIAAALRPHGRLFIDGGSLLREIQLDD